MTVYQRAPETGGRGQKDQSMSFFWGCMGGGNIGAAAAYSIPGGLADSQRAKFFGMPKATCHESIITDFCKQTGESKSKGGIRNGGIDIWRSSCWHMLDGWTTQAQAAVDVVVSAAAFKEGTAGWVSPCMFGDMFASAMGMIAARVGSFDPVTGLAVPGKGEEGYVPRGASWIFGGDKHASSWPDFDDPWTADSWWYEPQDGGTEPNSKLYTSAWRKNVGNAEFCRGVLAKTYPCWGNSGTYAGNKADGTTNLCGNTCVGTSGLFGCSNWVCAHHPLEWYQRKFTDMRLALFDAVLAYEKKNAALLGGYTIDAACAANIGEGVASSPEVTALGVDADQVAYEAHLRQEKLELEEAARLQELYETQIAKMGLGGGLGELPGWIKFGGAAVVALVAFRLYRRRRG